MVLRFSNVLIFLLLAESHFTLVCTEGYFQVQVLILCVRDVSVSLSLLHCGLALINETLRQLLAALPGCPHHATALGLCTFAHACDSLLFGD